MPSPTRDLETIVTRHQVGIWRYLRALGADPALAEDLLQDCLVIALRRGVQDRGDAAVATFLRATARHLLLRRRRDEGRRAAILLELADRMWEQDCGGDDGEHWLAALRACLAQLDGRPRQVVRLFYGEGRDRAATARALGMREAGVKTLLQRVRQVLRRCVHERIGGEA